MNSSPLRHPAAHALAICAALAGLLALAPNARAATTVRVLQMNLCHSGHAKDCYTGSSVITKAVSVITATNPSVLSLDEVCGGDVETLTAAVGAGAHAQFTPARYPDGKPKTCTNGQPYGIAVVVAAPLAGVTSVDTGVYAAQDNSSDERRVWACLVGGPVTACGTHLAKGGGPTAMAQCKEFMKHAASYADRMPTVAAGDMNLRYQGSPNVQDCDPSGFFRKGDGDLQHVFASRQFGFTDTRTIDMDKTTDHPALLVTLTL